MAPECTCVEDFVCDICESKLISLGAWAPLDLYEDNLYDDIDWVLEEDE